MARLHGRGAAEKPGLVALSYRLQAEAERRTWDAASRAKHNLFESRPEFLSQPEASGLLDFLGTVIAVPLVFWQTRTPSRCTDMPLDVSTPATRASRGSGRDGSDPRRSRRRAPWHDRS